MYRGKVTKVDAKGVYVQTADLGTIGPCQYVGATPAAGDMVILADMGDDASPDLVAITGVGRVTIDEAGALTATGVLKVYKNGDNAWVMRQSAGVHDIYDTWSVNGNQRFYIAGTQSNWSLVTEADLVGGRITAINVARTTGRVTIPAATTAGLEMGSGGPTITSGTGAPSHSPPNGSLYLRTDGTATTTLYVRAAGAWTALS